MCHLRRLTAAGPAIWLRILRPDHPGLVDHPRLELRSRLQWRPDMPNEDFGRRRGENLQRAPRIGDGTWQHV